MIPTIRVNNGSFASFANVTIQATPSPITQQTTTPSHPLSPVIPVYQSLMATPMMFHTPDSIKVVRQVSLATLANSLTQASTSRFIFPINASYSNIVPTHALALDASRVYDPRLTQGFINTTTKFQPFEQLTGIAHERPEIVMLTNFQPLFNRDVSHIAPHFINRVEESGYSQFMTDAGRYIDAQFNIRNLRTYNVTQNIQMLRVRYTHIDQQFYQREVAFSEALNKLKEDASFLLNLMRIIESQKRQLDLRHDVYVVDPREIAEFIQVNFANVHTSMKSFRSPSVLTQLVEASSQANYTCVDTLVDQGYNSDSVKNVFSSTKIWMQLLVELKRVLQHHSLKFLDIDPTYQKNDVNPSTISSPPIKYFGVSDNLPAIPPLDEVISLKLENATEAIGLLQSTFTGLYQNVFFKNEEARLAALAHLISQEYKYSHALSKPAVVTALQNYYGYQVVDSGNSTVFDNVVGRFGNNITDLPATEDQSLASIAQNRSSENKEVGVLTFETKYVEGDTGTLTPGGDFYFDRILETDGRSFNTSAINVLAKEMEDQTNQLSVIIDGFNLMKVPSHPNQGHHGAALEGEASFLNTSTDVIWVLAREMMNTSTGQAFSSMTTDRLGSIYCHAKSNNRVKTLLFLYTMCRISRSYNANSRLFFASLTANDNTPLTDFLIDELVDALEASVPNSRSVVQFMNQNGLDKGLNTSALTRDSIKSAFKAGTAMTKRVEQFMSDIVQLYRVKSSAISNNVTRYSGHLDTIMMMAAFDFAISMVARYNNQTLVGSHHGLTNYTQGPLTFVVSQTTTNHRASFNELLQRQSSEDETTRQLVMTVLNVMKKMSGSLKGISNYLNSVEAKNKLSEIATVLDNNPAMMRMLFSEQQIMMLASTVESLVTANAAGMSNSQSPSEKSYHDDGSNARRQITVLDESDVPPAMRDALLGYFGTGEFASQRGLNHRIMTVGIPLGFTQRLKQKVNIQTQKRASFENKQNDIIKITVYKTDVQNSDIIYKPQQFMFELSRFPTRYTTAHWLPIPQEPTLNDIINAIPTQCFDSSPEFGTSNSISSGVEYASSAIANSEGVKGVRAAFVDSTYNFLTAAQKAEILHNHVVSQLLEVYIKMMTGINVAEYNYHMVEPAPPIESNFVKSMTEHSIAHVAATISAKPASPSKPSGGLLFSTTAPKTVATVKQSYAARGITAPVLSNPSSTPLQVSSAAFGRSYASASPETKTLEEQANTFHIGGLLGDISKTYAPLLVETFKTVSTFANTFSSVSDINALNKKILSPKQFDRVLSVIVDPTGFEIDVKKTCATPYGQQALDLLLRHGDVLPTDETSQGTFKSSSANRALVTTNTSSGNFPQGRPADNVNNFRFRDRDKNQGDLIADRYFVTIETFGEEEI